MTADRGGFILLVCSMLRSRLCLIFRSGAANLDGVEGGSKVNRRVQSDQRLGALFACGKPVFVPRTMFTPFIQDLSEFFFLPYPPTLESCLCVL